MPFNANSLAVFKMKSPFKYEFIVLVVTVPIIPEFLYNINHPDAPLDGPVRTTTTTESPCKEYLRKHHIEYLPDVSTDADMGKDKITLIYLHKQKLYHFIRK